MPPVVLTLLQALFLLLLYVFVARAVRAVVRELSPGGQPAPAGRLRAPLRAPAAPKPSERRRRGRAAEPTELVVHLPGEAPRILGLDDEAVGAGITFGRAADTTVQLDDPYASDRHARVYRTDEGLLVADLGSTNGTYLNKSKVTTPTRIVPGDQIAIGKTVVEVRR
jgi:pSer/pThr/pTyr-binding forkhead associated (FHA) protein